MGLLVTEPLRRRLTALDGPRSARRLSGLTALSLLGILVFALAPHFWWAAGAWTGLGVLYGPVYSAWLNQGLAPGTRATVNSLASQADALGQVSFGPLFGLAGNLWGVRVALALAALVRLPILALFRRGQVGTPAERGWVGGTRRGASRLLIAFSARRSRPTARRIRPVARRPARGCRAR